MENYHERVLRTLREIQPVAKAMDKELVRFIEDSVNHDTSGERPKVGGAARINAWRTWGIRGVAVSCSTRRSGFDAFNKDFIVGDTYGGYRIGNLREARRMAHLFVKLYDLRLLEEN